MSSKDITWHWHCRDDSTKIDRRIKSIREEVITHPLQCFIGKQANTSNDKSKSNDEKLVKRESSIFSDPLGVMLDGDDPLSLFQRQAAENEDDEADYCNRNSSLCKFKSLQPWETKKEEILSQFNSQDVLARTSLFALRDKVLNAMTSISDRADDFEDGFIIEVNDMTPNDFYSKIKGFHREVVQAWEEDQRVKAIKIVIQCSKLLSESKAYSFYPNKFLYVTDILDTFGDLVYTRLRAKCEELWKPDTYNGKYLKTFPDNYTSEIVPDAAKETCHNWFYKIASIRELIPRLYVETALLRSYTFLKTGEYHQILSKLTKMARGVGDPLVNIYLRCYICRVAALYCNECNYDFFAENFFEFVSIYPSIFTSSIMIRKALNVTKYIEGFVPPAEWIVQGVIESDETVQYSLFDSFKRTAHSALLLLIAMASFKSSYIISQARVILGWIDECNYDEVPIHKFVKQLGTCFEKHSDEHLGVIGTDVLDPVWILIHRIDSTPHYVACVEQWLTLSITNLPVKRVDLLLGDIVKHVGEEKNRDKYYPQLENVVRNLMDSMDDFMSLIITENFMPFVRLFRGESVKVNVSKIIMEAFIKRSHETFISDTVVLNNVMTIARWLHDSINALTVEDEKRQIGKLLSSFVRRIDFGRDFEKQLEFYVDARGSFFYLDVVHTTLVYCINKLAFETLRVVKGRHTSRTSAFVRACSACCFITIPSIDSAVVRLQLYMLSGQTALANQCLGQADAFYMAAIDTIPEFPKKLDVEGNGQEKSSDYILMAYIRELYSILLAVPDNPTENRSVSLIYHLLETLPRYQWVENNAARISVSIQALHVLNAAYQSHYPYHFLNVDSNDSLYASDTQFQTDINEICSSLLQQILNTLIVLGESGQTEKQAELSYELFFCVLTRADVAHIEMAKLSINLWKLANKHVTVDKSIAITTLRRCIAMSPAGSTYTQVFNALLAKLE